MTSIMRAFILIIHLLLCSLTGCTLVQRRALTPETVGVTIGGSVGFDRSDDRGSPRNLGINIAVTPVWRIKPAPVAKVSDTTGTLGTTPPVLHP